MSRTVIWETPENAEEFADVPCEFQASAYSDVCGRLMREHAASVFELPSHAWRIYRDEPDTQAVVVADASADANLSLRHAMTALYHIAGAQITPDATAHGMLAIDRALPDLTPEQRAYIAIVYVMARLGIRFEAAN